MGNGREVTSTAEDDCLVSQEVQPVFVNADVPDCLAAISQERGQWRCGVITRCAITPARNIQSPRSRRAAGQLTTIGRAKPEAAIWLSDQDLGMVPGSIADQPRTHGLQPRARVECSVAWLKCHVVVIEVVARVAWASPPGTPSGAMVGSFREHLHLVQDCGAVRVDRASVASMA